MTGRLLLGSVSQALALHAEGSVEIVRGKAALMRVPVTD